MLTAMLKQAQRELAKTDVYVYAEYVFGYNLAQHHHTMIDFVLDLLEKGQSGVVLAPRGSGKTTILNTILLSWYIATHPDIRIGLFSQKDKKAEAMSDAIRFTISESEAFKEIFGDLRGLKWTSSEWSRKGSVAMKSKDATMITGGVSNSSAVSKRFDIIFCDDILDAENTYNIDRREKTEDWFWRSLKPAQAAEGVSVVVVGTRWTEGDLYERLIETNKWPNLTIAALDNETGESYWPEVWPIERLEKEREDIGWDNFACAYLNDVSGLREGLIFKKEWFDYFDELPKGNYTWTMGVDLASSERERADWTTRVVVAESEDHHYYVMGTNRMKAETGHRQFVEAGAAAFPTISRIVIENNQHQSTLVQDLLDQTKLPVVGKRTDVDKRTRARGVATRYESHRVHHHRSLKGAELEMEMLGFPKGHDDLIDALGLAMDIGAPGLAFATVDTTPMAIAAELPQGKEVRFLTGLRIVPDHVATMLSGIDTTRYSYEEAMMRANSRQLDSFVGASIRGLLS